MCTDIQVYVSLCYCSYHASACVCWWCSEPALSLPLPPCLSSLQLVPDEPSQGTGGEGRRCAWQWLVTICTTSINTLHCTHSHNRSRCSCCWRGRAGVNESIRVCVCASSPWQQCSRDPLLVTLSYYLMQWSSGGSGSRIFRRRWGLLV